VCGLLFVVWGVCSGGWLFGCCCWVWGWDDVKVCGQGRIPPGGGGFGGVGCGVAFGGKRVHSVIVSRESEGVWAFVGIWCLFSVWGWRVPRVGGVKVVQQSMAAGGGGGWW